MKYPHALVLALLLLLGTAWAKEKFAEEGLVEWLEDGRLLLHLRFYQDTDAVRHTTFFPTAILDLAQRSNFEELQLHLTRGRWDHATWGPPKFPIHPAGAELEVAWPDQGGNHPNFASSREEWQASANGRAWSDLTHRLSGLLCSSLNLLAAPDVVAQHVNPLLLHQQLQEGEPRPQLHRQYAALPREAICTENLTPWLKLLPCRDAAGLATLLLDRKKLFGGGYHSLSTNVGVSRDQGGTLKSVRLIQTATAVLFVPSGFSEGPPSLSTFFPASLTRACQAATSSNLYLRQSAESGMHKQHLKEKTLKEKTQYKGHDVLATAAQSPEGLQTLMAEARLPELNGSSLGGGTYSPPVVARRALTGAGTFKGHYQLSIDLQGLAQGPAEDGSQELLCVYQVIPWFLRLWVHTLDIRLDGEVAPPSQMLFHHLQPSNDRASPLVLEFCLGIPQGSQTLDVSAEFTKLFLTVFEHPPDAHRGFDIPAAIISYFQQENCHIQGPNALRAALKSRSASKGTCIQEVYSEGSLVQLATPDFSMPYNVICLSSTVMGVFVGSTLNTLTFRPGKLLTLDPQTKKKQKIRMAIGIVLLLGVGITMAVQVDAEFAEQVDGVLKLLGLGMIPSPEARG